MSVEQLLADSVCVLFCGAEANLTGLNKCRPMIVRQGKVKRMLEWLSHVCVFSLEHLPPERQQPQHLIREIGLELVTSEALATQGMESKLRCLFSEHAATAWNLGNGQSFSSLALHCGPDFSASCTLTYRKVSYWNTYYHSLYIVVLTSRRPIEVNMPNLTAKSQVVFIHHQLIFPRFIGKMHRGRTAWENLLDLPDYNRFYADVREGLFTGRKCAEGAPTPLPVTVHGHPGRFAHTILREGDLCALVCTVEARAWRDRFSGRCSGTGA
ncbi:BQ5605_C005g03553 [Microbotryum silenes-dioicae]|uniref:BQ5605_C005g03553 protein n=1 Tax=Microbotryum silenes-dioicae TaxID=796604 RepID=A0A2X0P6U2_9BASI|nr:BQ5605_C005g03553 [Microbotryum silenes-dioicae]